jgi:DNA-binding CsgD family transcriptional regulator
MTTAAKNSSRLGDIGALIRVTTPLAAHTAPLDATARKRRMVAMFCRILGEQMLDGKPAPVAQEPLSPRERQTLELLLTGFAEKQIAARLAISKHTVHVYVKSLHKRFNVSSRGELLAQWVQR